LSSPGLTGRSSNHRPQLERHRQGYWIPACAGMTVKQASVLLTAARERPAHGCCCHPSRRAFGPPQDEEFPRRGWRAERRNLIARDPKIAWAPRGAPLRSLAVIGPAFAAPCPASRRGLSSTGRKEFGIGRRVVSQLLAGPRSGPGGSPTPPRVACCDTSPAGTPHLIPPHNASRNALQKDEVRSV
jgi:hypothetical protein